jgi:methionyl-tRNA formyltransferase
MAPTKPVVEDVYVVATIRPWNINIFNKRIRHFPGHWHLVTGREDLTLERLIALGPKMVFFPHWSWKVDREIVDKFECIAFHPTDLPYGRGGSPIQNLISRGHRDTQLTAFRMGFGLDDGPIYLKRPFSLEGTAEEIFARSANLAADMIEMLITEKQIPQPQTGKAVFFKRRTPDQSRLPHAETLNALFDHIRMLDANEYPRAFLDAGKFRIEFRNPVLHTDRVEAFVSISERIDD